MKIRSEVVKCGNRDASFRAKNEVIEFEPILTNAIGYNAKEWCKSAPRRATLAVLLMIDSKTAFGDLFAFDLFHEVFLERTGNQLLLAFHHDSVRLMVIYNAFRKKAVYSFAETAGGEIFPANSFKGKRCWYSINANEIIDCFMAVEKRLKME